MKYLSLLFLAFCLSTNVFAASPAEDFAQALSLQQGSKNEEAIKLYEQVAQSGQTSPELYNNLGLAYLNQNNLGKAIVQFERALKLAPTHSDALHNLAVAEQKVENLSTALPASGIASTWASIAGLLSPNLWALVAFLCAAGIAFIIYKLDEAKKWGWVAACTLALFFVLALGHSQKNRLYHSPKAVLLTAKVGLRQQPNIQAQEIEFIHQGASGLIVERQADWLRLQLPNGFIGWLPASLTEEV
jgi:tetratricopeptide (TPR) repeat protein